MVLGLPSLVAHPLTSFASSPDIYLEEIISNDASETLDAEPEPMPEPMATETAHTAASDPLPVSHTPELYDSGATCHMTPLRNSLTNYRAIAPKSISVANQLTFSAIGCRDLLIHVPNGHSDSKILLRDVLHMPDIAQTLISVGLISNAGYSVTFKDGSSH